MHPGTAGAGAIYTFPKGLVIASGTEVVLNNTGNATAGLPNYSCYFAE